MRWASIRPNIVYMRIRDEHVRALFQALSDKCQFGFFQVVPAVNRLLKITMFMVVRFPINNICLGDFSAKTYSQTDKSVLLVVMVAELPPAAA